MEKLLITLPIFSLVWWVAGFVRSSCSRGHRRYTGSGRFRPAATEVSKSHRNWRTLDRLDFQAKKKRNLYKWWRKDILFCAYYYCMPRQLKAILNRKLIRTLTGRHHQKPVKKVILKGQTRALSADNFAQVRGRVPGQKKQPFSVFMRFIRHSTGPELDIRGRS